MSKRYIDFAGRKLTGLVFCTTCMVMTAVSTLSMSAAKMLDGTFAQNLTITVVGGIATLYATFVGGNYGEHVAKNKFGNGSRTSASPQPVKAAVEARASHPTPNSDVNSLDLPEG